MKKVGLLAIAHGSKSREHVEVVFQIVNRLLSSLSEYDIVAHEVAFMGSRKGLKSIHEALKELSTKCEEIVVLPLFLTPGKHVSSDIPREMGLPNCSPASKHKIQVEGRHITLIYANPIGFDERVVEILRDRFKEAYNMLIK